MISLLLPLLLLAGDPADAPRDAVARTLAEGEAARAAGDYAALLAAAQALEALGATPAEGQADLATQWAQEARAQGQAGQAAPYRGRALGPAYRRGALAAGGSVTLRQLFLAGQRARISVTPAGKNGADRLSLRVRDGAGGTLCQKPAAGAPADCAWLPVFTDRYAIEIGNAGAAPAVFYLVIR